MANQLIGRLSVSGGSAPVLDTLNVTTNGTYTPPSGTDGYNEVNVDVPSVTPVLGTLNVTTNGTYTPPTGTDGYNEVNVNVPSVTPVLSTLSVTANGTYTPPAGTDGYNEVNVAVPAPVLTNVTYTKNGRYTPPSGVDGYNNIRVNVPNMLMSNNSTIFIDGMGMGNLLVSLEYESINSIEDLNQHYADEPYFYNILMNVNKWSLAYSDYEGTTPVGYVGFYNGSIRAWDLSLANNINLTDIFATINLSNANQQQSNPFTPYTG